LAEEILKGSLHPGEPVNVSAENDRLTSVGPIRSPSEATIPDAGEGRTQVPLSWPMKCFAIILPCAACAGLPVLLLAKAGYTRRGEERKVKELLQWFVAGVFLWALVFFLLCVLFTRHR
jgi:hypothetical protein